MLRRRNPPSLLVAKHYSVQSAPSWLYILIKQKTYSISRGLISPSNSRWMNWCVLLSPEASSALKRIQSLCHLQGISSQWEVWSLSNVPWVLWILWAGCIVPDWCFFHSIRWHGYNTITRAKILPCHNKVDKAHLHRTRYQKRFSCYSNRQISLLALPSLQISCLFVMVLTHIQLLL